MKKSTDILLRIILVVSILGAIFFYYYGKFITSRKVVVKSGMVMLPPFPEKKKLKNNIKNKKIVLLGDNNTFNKSVDNNTIKKNKKFKILISNYPLKNNILQIKKYVSKYKNIIIKINPNLYLAEFKRIFVGPFNSKFRMIKMENRLRKLNIEPLRIKINGVYYLHCGSFLFDKKANEFKNFLFKNGIKNIVFFKFKKKIKVYNMELDNITNQQFKEITKYLNKLQIKYNVQK